MNLLTSILKKEPPSFKKLNGFLFFFFSFVIVSCDNSATNTNSIDNQSITNEESKYSINIDASCSFSGELLTNQVYGFEPDNGAQMALGEIMKYTGLPINFKLIAADVDNASAVIQKKSSGDMLRYIMYNQHFMISLKDRTKTHWSETSILAHEIGHHLSGHTLLTGGSRPDIELEADRFSGYILYKMGATLEDAQIAINTLIPDYPSLTHPGKKPRIVAITNGWLAAKEQDFSNRQTTKDETSISESLSKAIETTSESVRERILKILNQYYQIGNSSDCNLLANFYLPIVDNFYNKSSLTVNEIVGECINYNLRWPYQEKEVDSTSVFITNMNDGDFFVTYDMFYKVKQTFNANWKNFNLTINVRFTPDLKIKSIYEYQKSKY